MKTIPLALTYDDVLLVPQRSAINSRSLVSLTSKITPTKSLAFPVISINMDTVTGIETATAMHRYGGVSFYPRFKSPQEQARDIKFLLSKSVFVIPAIGIRDMEFERAELLIKTGATVLTIDIAHGHLEANISFIKKLKTSFPAVEIIAGVVATYEGARDLFEAGADAVRVGVGPGTICTTRKITGSGVPQITAIMEAARAGKKFNRPIIADGGMKNSGDIVKALAAGASAVVLGSQLAGTDEAPGEIIEKNNKKFKAYNGSTCKTEKQKQFNQYNAGKTNAYTSYIEGTESLVPYKGPLEDILAVLEKGIRSGLSYSGARTIEELHQKAQFVQITNASIGENGAHGVYVSEN